MDLTKETHKRKENEAAAVSVQKAPVSVASGVVVKFQSNNSRRSRHKRGATKKPRREFFEHDTRKGSALKMKWPGGGTVAPALAADTGAAAIGIDAGAGGCNEKMNSKARRAAKFREMKVLQRIMLSKEVNMAELLPNWTPAAIAASSNCCHCNCAASVKTTENSVAATSQQCVTSSNGGFGGGGGGGSFLMTEKEVFKSCSVR